LRWTLGEFEFSKFAIAACLVPNVGDLTIFNELCRFLRTPRGNPHATVILTNDDRDLSAVMLPDSVRILNLTDVIGVDNEGCLSINSDALGRRVLSSRSFCTVSRSTSRRPAPRARGRGVRDPRRSWPSPPVRTWSRCGGPRPWPSASPHWQAANAPNRRYTTGSSNTANGLQSLFSNTTGSSNTALGYLALEENTTGTFNIGIGQDAGYIDNAGLTGSTNLFIGYRAGRFNSSAGTGAITGSGNIVIGSNQNMLPTTTASTTTTS
jgi:hypothetical protein